MALVVKNRPDSAGDLGGVGSISGQEDPLEEDMASHSSILTWRIPQTEEPDSLPSRGPQRVGHNQRDSACMYWVFSPVRIRDF